MFRGCKKFPCCTCGRNGDGDHVDHAGIICARNNSTVLDRLIVVKAGARRFRWNEIELLTSGFTSAKIGEGGFSTVYLAGRSSSMNTFSPAAVKVHRSSCSERIHRAFRLELDVLLRVRHPHVVRLLGFCEEQEEGVLVLEFAPNGNLHDKLHGGGGLLTWARRVAIAYQVAKALEYLHEKCEPQIVHGDVKASNVLLDADMSVKLCDFGSARVGFSAAVQPRAPSPVPMIGSLGYVDPHYLRSGMITKKSDVYSFGVLMLELVTGIQAFCAKKEQLVTAAVHSRLCSGAKAEELVDPLLGEEYDAAEATAVVSAAAACTGDNPSIRPSMSDLVRIIERAAAASIAAAVRRQSDATKKS